MDDFKRLQRIAEGNPDEQKIGFFGVGFYSLFSICEEPFVSSGEHTMAFLWRGDALFTKRGQIPQNQMDEWTTFFLTLREPMDLPKASEFGRFLATSMAFTTQIKQIQVFSNEERIQNYIKKISDPRSLSYSHGEYTMTSPNSLFRLLNISIRNIQVDF